MKYVWFIIIQTIAFSLHIQRLDVNQSLILTGQNNDCWSSWSLQGSVKLWLFLSRVIVGRREPLRSHVEGQLRPHPDCSRGRSSADRAGTEAGGPTPHALRPLVLEGLQETQGTSLWTLDIVSDSCLITFFFLSFSCLKGTVCRNVVVGLSPP